MKKNALLTVMILAIQIAFSQDYLISFVGSGASNTFDSISVENLSQETTVTIYTEDSLLLIGSVGILYQNSIDNVLHVYPNPMSNNATLSVFAIQAGNIRIAVYDISGKIITEINDVRSKGFHEYQVSGLDIGSYFVQVTGNNINYVSKLICQNKTQTKAQINYISTVSQNIPNTKKGNLQNDSRSIVSMDYNYGDQLLFKAYSNNFTTIVTDIPTEDKTIAFEFIECIDYDGNNYAIVQIGDQIWMAESLKTTHYRNGTPIPNVLDNDEWTNLETGAYCWYDNDISHKAIYGALYNWYTVNNPNNIAPIGWHVPTKDEEMELTGAPSGSYSHSGGTLKETGNAHWTAPNVGATNETGFTALPGGYRLNTDGSYHEIGLGSYFSWSSTEDWGENSWYSAVENINDRAYMYGYFRNCGFSVRCVKD